MLREFYNRIFLFKFLLATVNGLILRLITRILGSSPYSHSTFFDTIQFADGRRDIARHHSHKHDKKAKKKSKDHRRSRSFGPGDQLAVSTVSDLSEM